jgi:hypothetical protein
MGRGIGNVCCSRDLTRGEYPLRTGPTGAPKLPLRNQASQDADFEQLRPGRHDDSWVRSNRKGLLAATVIAMVIAAGTSTPGLAMAEPPADVQDATSLTLGLRAFGINPLISLYGVEGSQTLTIPVPPGMTPAELEATAVLPVNVRGAIVEAAQDDRILSRVPVPGTDEAPVNIPLAGAEVVDNAVTVVVRSYLQLPDGFCAYDPTHPLRLTNSAVHFTGKETPPTTVSDFLPPVLQKLSLFVPTDPTRAESEAAIRLATITAARYGPQFTAIDVAQLGPAPLPPPQALERQIVIKGSDQPSVRLEGAPNSIPALVISGSDAEITNQARLLSSDVSLLAFAPAVVVADALRTAATTVIGDVTTIRELGQDGVNATALVNPQVTLPLDQTRIGRPIHGARVHLIGAYTPLPSGLGGRVSVSAGGQYLTSWPTDETGRIDRWVDIPDRVVGRLTNVDVAVNAAGNTGLCGEFQPLTLNIDGASVVQTSPAQPPIPGGFQSLPQALMPRIEVGMDNGFDNTRRAVQILVGQQRLTGQPLDTALVSVDEAVHSANSAIIISPDNWTVDDITLPVTFSSDGNVTVQNVDGTGQAATVRLTPAVRAGSLQTLLHNNRTLLIATSNGAPDQLDRLLGWLNGDVTRWQRLSGSAVLATPDRAPVSVPLRVEKPAADAASAAGDSSSTAVFVVAAAAAVILVLGLVWMWLRRRRSRGHT